MSEPSRRSSRHKIEPLNYAEMAKAPALKGAISFLDVSAADVRSGNFESFGPRPVATSDTETPPGDETSPTVVLSPTSDSASTRRVTSISSKAKAAKTSASSLEIPPKGGTSPRHPTSPGSVASPVVVSLPEVVLYPEGVTTPGYETPAHYNATFARPPEI